jgi:hypothetical protein
MKRYCILLTLMKDFDGGWTLMDEKSVMAFKGKFQLVVVCSRKCPRGRAEEEEVTERAAYICISERPRRSACVFRRGTFQTKYLERGPSASL